jgi:hypothetical protein
VNSNGKLERNIRLAAWLLGYRALHDEDIHNFHASSNIIRAMKSRGMRWAGHGVRMGQMRNACKIFGRKI